MSVRSDQRMSDRWNAWDRMAMIQIAVIPSSHLPIFRLPEEHEDIRVDVVDIEQAMQWLHEGRIKSSATIIALQWLALNESTLKSD